MHGFVSQRCARARGRGRQTERVGEEGVIALSYAFDVNIALCRKFEWDHAQIYPVFEEMLAQTCEMDAPWQPGPGIPCIYLAQNSNHYWCVYGR